MNDVKDHPRRRLRRLASSAIAVVMVILALGFAFQTLGSAADAQAYPPPGQLVDIGGYRLHLYCSGEGSPTVVLDSGLGGSWLDWSWVQPKLAETTRICAYDRAGMGWSDPGPEPRDARRAVEELHALLQNADVSGPLILVGHSNGALRAQLYAATYPNDVAGLVLVDPTLTQSTEEQIAELPAETRARIEALLKELNISTEIATPDQNLGMQALAALAPLGVMRLFGGGLLELSDALPADAAGPYRAVAMRTGYLPAVLAESRQIRASMQEVRDQQMSLGDRPLVVLLNAARLPDPSASAAEQELQRLAAPLVRMAGDALASLSSRGQLELVEGSGHYIQIDQPETVIQGIEHVIDAVRRG